MPKGKILIISALYQRQVHELGACRSAPLFLFSHDSMRSMKMQMTFGGYRPDEFSILPTIYIVIGYAGHESHYK